MVNEIYELRNSSLKVFNLIESRFKSGQARLEVGLQTLLAALRTTHCIVDGIAGVRHLEHEMHGEEVRVDRVRIHRVQVYVLVLQLHNFRRQKR